MLSASRLPSMSATMATLTVPPRSIEKHKCACLNFATARQMASTACIAFGRSDRQCTMVLRGNVRASSSSRRAPEDLSTERTNPLYGIRPTPSKLSNTSPGRGFQTPRHFPDGATHHPWQYKLWCVSTCMERTVLSMVAMKMIET